MINLLSPSGRARAVREYRRRFATVVGILAILLATSSYVVLRIEGNAARSEAALAAHWLKAAVAVADPSQSK